MLFLVITAPAVHPIHVSVSEVEIGKEKMEWTARIFKDDLLLGVYGPKASMEKLNDPDRIKGDIVRYVSKNIVVTLDARPIQWILSDIQPDPEAIWITLEADISGWSSNSLTVSNRLLMETYKDQKNIVNFSSNAKTQHLIFEFKDGLKTITF